VIIRQRGHQGGNSEGLMREMSAQVLDIFAGHSEKRAVWLEAAVGLENAKQRMLQIAAEKPGDYFVFDVRTREIVARISTGPSKSGRRGKGASSKKSAA
jgi:hypothetical protein